MNCCGALRERLEIGDHKHLAVGTRLQHLIGIRDAVEREAAGDVANDSWALHGQSQGIRNQIRKFVETFDPMHTVVLGNEDGRGKELVEVDGGHRTGQLTGS
jgi:hypothetical protein